MAANCAQVKQTLDTGGMHDKHDPWWHMLMLAACSEDGRHWAHEISKDHPDYTQAETDTEYDGRVAAHAGGMGPPLCTTINGDRPGICPGCPHWTNPAITTPFHVGLKILTGSPDELPDHWRRHNGWIERDISDEKTIKWSRVLEGDVTKLLDLDQIATGYRFTFTYTPPNLPPRTLYVDNAELTAKTAKSILTSRHMHINDDNALHVSRLMMSWIEKLQRETRVRTQPMPSFGWYKVGATYMGFSSGGVCYVTGGGDEPALGADATLIKYYTPKGDLATWRAAAEFIGKDCPELQINIAVAFAAPLMELQGDSGAVLSFVGKSGLGKSSAIKAGQAVWADTKPTIFTVKDTSAFKGIVKSDLMALPIYWDEARVADDIKILINELHSFTQGRDKGRSTADIKIREPGEWLTLYSISANDSIRDLITSHQGDTEATLLRLLEIRVERNVKYDVRADSIEADLRDNHGEAGRVYARYLADNVDAIKLKLATKKIKLDTRFNPSNDERFYMRTMAAIIVGAELARDLNIITLDIAGIARVLENAFNKSRIARNEETPVDPKDNLHSHFDQYITAYAHECVVTEFYKRPGPGPKPRIVFQPDRPPKEDLGIAYHIGVNDKVIRVNMNVWRRYWNAHVISPTNLRDQAKAEWGAPGVATRGLGHGTRFQTRAYAFELSLAGDLEEILDPYISVPTSRTGTGTVIPMPAR